MQGDKEKWVPENSEINGSKPSDTAIDNNAIVAGSSEKPSLMINSESFYQKLTEFFESSGLSLVFNARETMLDLLLFYKEVTQRGGFNQVTRDKKWDEVASSVKLEGSNLKLVAQLQKLYITLLYQFEQILSYTTPEKPATGPENSSGMKRKYPDNLTFMLDDFEDAQMGKVKCNDNSWLIPKGPAEHKFSLLMPSKNKLVEKPDPPRGVRNPYQIFLRKECARLRSIHGESLNGQNVRDMAIDAWRKLSLKDREPYVEESRKDKARFWQEMIVYMEQNAECSMTSGDYHVSSQPEAESSFVVDQSMVDLAARAMKTAPSDLSISTSNWYEFYG